MDNIQECYNILGVTSFSSLEDIKKEYRKLCLKYHPDKNKTGDSDMFMKINTAYEVVIKNKETNINFFIMFFYFIKTFGKDCNIQLYIEVCLEDVYNNKIKKISYQQVDKKLNKIQQTVYLELNGWKEKYDIDEMGDYNIVTKRHGTLIINLNIKNIDNDQFQLNKILNLYDISTVIYINLYEYYYGLNRQLQYYNNEIIELKYIPYIEGKTQLIKEKGLMDDNNKRCDLYVFYEVNLDKYEINDNNKVFIKNIFNK